MRFWPPARKFRQAYNGRVTPNISRRRLYPTFREIAFIALLVALVVVSSQISLAQNFSAKVTRYMSAQVQVNQFRGSILVAEKGKVLIEGNYGFPSSANISDEVKSYAVGAIAKQFIAAAILQMQERGKLRLENSICLYIDKCPETWKTITILSLLAQTDGILDRKIETGDQERLVSELEAAPIESKPGKFRYTNSGYELLATVIHKISGEPYEKYLQEEIFQPSGMTDTGKTLKPPSEDRPAVAITPSDGKLSEEYSFGRITSTVDDLYRWERALDGSGLLSRESITKMFTPYSAGHGFGWVMLEEYNRQAYTQGYGIYLFAASIRRYPKDDVCVVVLSDDADSGRISRDLGAMVFGVEYATPKPAVTIDMNSVIYDSYVGNYRLAPDFILHVVRSGKRLFAQSPNLPAVEIYPKTQTQFFAKGSDTVLNFVKNGSEKATEVVVQMGGADIPGMRVN